MKKEKKVLILRTCKEGLEKLVNGEINPRYREAKSFWESRLFDKEGKPKEFDEIHIINGYKSDSPTVILEFGGISGIEEFNGKNCFKINLGKIIEIRNYLG
ncbi:hypothetical protein BLD25_02850 [Candidatus Gracilibacteria bacterium GN02-872]|nr:hypothetical protein BLD25_02850 [Candidatus Gracilibacteria bacterium GN02-872]